MFLSLSLSLCLECVCVSEWVVGSLSIFSCFSLDFLFEKGETLTFPLATAAYIPNNWEGILSDPDGSAPVTGILEDESGINGR